MADTDEPQTDEPPAGGSTPAQHIDAMIAAHPDWRGAVLADARAAVLAVDPAIKETWKWRGAPVWELDGILVVGNVFKEAVKLGFMYGASLDDPDGLFNDELGGNQRRAIKYFAGDAVDVPALQALVRRAIEHDHTRRQAGRRR
ncbi:DUF1801 domain-containing protein [Curtobacterium sp. MCPF17_011]|uniref:DUF1801 domain-containing protein n=1 Tax=Curtobacterium sp. MCPF17_011 TaxID=2175652 RepID=UPI000DA9C810|nr:DUF1801 domain-containing protein [Curtobacterium sp. MCPF17_011]PZF13854.1 DUF1801 domain-containing protein [Curtobacterium sp. MCPF17_011]